MGRIRCYTGRIEKDYKGDHWKNHRCRATARMSAPRSRFSPEKLHDSPGTLSPPPRTSAASGLGDGSAASRRVSHGASRHCATLPWTSDRDSGLLRKLCPGGLRLLRPSPVLLPNGRIAPANSSLNSGQLLTGDTPSPVLRHCGFFNEPPASFLRRPLGVGAASQFRVHRLLMSSVGCPASAT